MKNKTLTIISAAIFLALIVIVSAYPVQIKLNANNQFNSTVYQCSSASCNSLSSIIASNYGNPITYSISGSGNQYFAEYDFVSDRCKVSHSYITNTTSTTGAGPWNYDLQFSKQPDCQSDINSVSAASQIYDDETLSVSVSSESPLELNPNGPQIVPLSLRYFYSTNASITIAIKNASQLSQTIATQTSSSDISWNANKIFSFTFDNLPAGTYKIETTSNVNDCMCSSSLQGTYPPITLVVIPSNNATEDTTPPVLSLPSTISLNTTNPLGINVLFTANATDNVDGNVPVICNPISGSLFSVGSTTVVCSATDLSGNTATGSFNVIVTFVQAPQCTTSSECGSSTTLNYFCSGNDLYRNVSVPSCLSGTCSFSTNSELNNSCPHGCSAGACLPQTITSILNGIRIIYPQPNQIFSTTATYAIVSLRYSVNGTATSCLYSLDGASNITLSSCQNTTLSASNGTHSITIYATNGTKTVSDTRSFRVIASTQNQTDTTPPVITIYSPINQNYTTNNIFINASINEPGTCIYNLNSGINKTLTTSGNYLISNENNLANGNYLFNIFCSDLSGNTANKTVSFVINKSTSNEDDNDNNDNTHKSSFKGSAMNITYHSATSNWTNVTAPLEFKESQQSNLSWLLISLLLLLLILLSLIIIYFLMK